MKFLALKFHSEQASRLILAGAGVLLISSSIVFHPPKAEAVKPIQIDCKEGFSAETPNYYVSICINKNGYFYVGRSKNGSDSLVLPISSARNGVYVAKNGQYTYVLHEKKRQLIITLPNGRRSIERIIRIIDS